MDPPKKPWELDSTQDIPPRPAAPVDSVDSLNAGSLSRPMGTMGYGSSPLGYNSGYGSTYNTGYNSGYGGYNSGYGGYNSGYGGYGGYNSGYGGYGSGYNSGYGGYGGYNGGGYNNRQFDGNSLSSRMEQETQQTFATIQQIVQVCIINDS
jgi:peroxin-13